MSHTWGRKKQKRKGKREGRREGRERRRKKGNKLLDILINRTTKNRGNL